jgi:hypothetical protein
MSNPKPRVKKSGGYHGHAKRGSVSRTYNIWSGMRKRCNNPNQHAFKYYGGRGIKVCQDWSNYEAFLADMGEAPAGLSLDRINNDGNYEPGNCRWATPKQQAENQRKPHRGVKVERVRKLKFYAVEFLSGADATWIRAGRFRATNTTGAIRQFVRRIKPNVCAIRAYIL